MKGKFFTEHLKVPPDWEEVYIVEKLIYFDTEFIFKKLYDDV